MNNIYKLFQEGKFKQVISAISSSENNIPLLELKGMAALKISDINTAKTCFETLLRKEKKTSHNYHLALCHMENNNYVAAITCFEKCKEDSKFSTAAIINQSHCYLKISETNKAENQLISLLNIFNHIKPAHFLLLNNYRENKQFIKLEIQLNKSENICRDDYEWKINKCYLLLNKNSNQELIEFIQSNNLQTSEVQNILAKSHMKSADFESAVVIYQSLVKNEPLNATQWYNLAAAYSHLTSDSDLNHAIQAANRCLELEPKHSQAFFCKTLVYEKIGNIDAALNTIDAAIELEPRNLEYRYKKAELYNLKGMPADSLNLLNKILSENPHFCLALRLKGIIQLQAHDAKDSEQTLQLALSQDNTDQRTLAYYVLSKLAQNKKQEVEEFLSLGHFVKEFRFDPQGEYINLEAFNRDFEADIKNHSLLRKEPNGLAARNGYLTDNIFKDKTKSIILFRKLLEQKIEKYISELPIDLQHHMLRHKTNEYEIRSWATWVKGDGFIDKHIHEESWLSGAYYCTVPEITETAKQHQGYFEYGCIPNDIQIDTDKKRGYIKPIEGKLVIFPSYLYHQTIPHESNEDRISVAFDLTPLSWKK